MSLLASSRVVSPGRVRAARSLALVADILQIVAFPLFFEGALSPLADALDLGIAAAMVLLLGWHWAFLPAFLLEVVPMFDLFPTWSAAVYFVTRGQTVAEEESGREPSTAPRMKDVTPPTMKG